MLNAHKIMFDFLIEKSANKALLEGYLEEPK